MIDFDWAGIEDDAVRFWAEIDERFAVMIARYPKHEKALSLLREQIVKMMRSAGVSEKGVELNVSPGEVVLDKMYQIFKEDNGTNEVLFVIWMNDRYVDLIQKTKVMPIAMDGEYLLFPNVFDEEGKRVQGVVFGIVEEKGPLGDSETVV